MVVRLPMLWHDRSVVERGMFSPFNHLYPFAVLSICVVRAGVDGVLQLAHAASRSWPYI